MTGNKVRSILFALLAAVFYAVSVPCSKLLLEHAGPTTMAALLYLGAGLGVGIMSRIKKPEKTERLTKGDLPFVIGMIVLDIAAPVFLMLGVSQGSSGNASLLGNFEIVATTLIALLVFKETVCSPEVLDCTGEVACTLTRVTVPPPPPLTGIEYVLFPIGDSKTTVQERLRAKTPMRSLC